MAALTSQIGGQASMAQAKMALLTPRAFPEYAHVPTHS